MLARGLQLKASDRTSDKYIGKNYNAFDISEATWALALTISKAYDRVCYNLLLQKVNSYGIPSQGLGLAISS